MAHSKLSDYTLLIKHLLNSQECLLEYQSKVEAMLDMVLERDLIDYPTLKLHSYLWALSDFVKKAAGITDEIMKALNQITTLLLQGDPP